MGSLQPHNMTVDQELTAKDLVLKIKEWISYLLSKWLIIGVAGLIGGGLGLLYAMSKNKQFIADLTFVVEESKSSPLSGYAGIASQFGIDLGGGSESGVFSGDNILTFLRTRLMVERTLLSPIEVDGKKMSIANFYLSAYNLREQWRKKPVLANINFPITTDRSKFTLVQDSVLNVLYESIIKSSLAVSKPDKKLGFILVRVATENEYLSKIFAERIVKEATDFYVQTKTQRSKTNVDKLQFRADSLEQLLNRKTYSVAISQDLNLNPARRVAVVGSELATRDKMVLQTMYAEVTKNLEVSKMAMAQETPVIQIIDAPILPLKMEKVGRLKAIILGGILLVFFTTIGLICRYGFREMMK